MSDQWERLTDFTGLAPITPPGAPVPAAHDLTHDLASAPVPHVNGMPAGQPVATILDVRMRQLMLAPAADRLYSHYQPADNDPQLAAYADAVAAMGDLVPPLLVLPAQQNITIGAETLPMFLVYHDPVLFAALGFLGRARARVQIPPVPHPGAILLMALSQQQHLRKPTLLEKCDTVRRLAEDYRYSAEEIGRHLAARDAESGEPPSPAYISRLVSVAHLPESVRDGMQRGIILLSHARLIADRFGHDERLADQLGRWLMSGPRKTVATLQKTINELAPPSGHPLAHLVEQDQGVALIREGVIRLMAAPDPLARLPGYSNVIAARSAAIRQDARGHQVVIIPHADPERVAVAAESVRALALELAAHDRPLTVRALETTLLGYLEAVRGALATAGLLSESGAVAPVVNAVEVAR